MGLEAVACGPSYSMSCGILGPQPGIKPVPPALQGRFFTTKEIPKCYFLISLYLFIRGFSELKELFNAHPYPFHLASVIVNILAYFCQHVTVFDLVDVVRWLRVWSQCAWVPEPVSLFSDSVA